MKNTILCGVFTEQSLISREFACNAGVMVMTCIKALTEVKMKVKDDVFRELTGMLSERKNLSLYESVPLDEGSYNLSESSY